MNELEIVQKAIDYIEDNLKMSFKVDFVADRVGYSYFHFHRLFLAVTGETIGGYIRSRRLTEAAFELAHSSNNITDIGLSYCFDTPESFTRAFKKRYGLPPSSYRNRGWDSLLGNRDRVDIKSGQFIVGRDCKVPEVIEIPEITVLGIPYRTENVIHETSLNWQKFNKEFEMWNVSTNRISIFDGEGLCLEQNFDLQHSVQVFLGFITNESSLLPRELVKEKKIAKGKYLRFIHRGPTESLLSTYRYIWGEWYLHNKYTLKEGIDFELYTERFKGPQYADSEIEIYIPIE